MTEASPNCVIGGRPHVATDGQLCRHHLEDLGRLLREIEDEAALLDPRPSMAQRAGRGGSLASQRAPVRIDVLVHTDPRRGTGVPLTGEPDPTGWDDTPSVLDVLHSWARAVREERGLAAPASITVTGERDLLTRQLSWIAAQPWVDEAYEDIRRLAAHLQARNGTARERAVGRCYLPADTGTCGGVIRRAAQPATAWRILGDRCIQQEIHTDDGHASCDRCGRTWDGPQLAMLNYELERARRPKDDTGQPLWSPAEIAAEHGVKPGTVAVWAHRRGIVSVQGYYDPRVFRKRQSA